MSWMSQAPTMGHSKYLSLRNGQWGRMAPTGKSDQGGMVHQWLRSRSPAGLTANWGAPPATGMMGPGAAPSQGSPSAGSMAPGAGGFGGGWGGGYSGFADIAQQPGGAVGMAGGGAAQQPGQNPFMAAFGRAQAEQTNMANEARGLRGQAFSDLGRLVNEPAISRRAERQNINNMLSSARSREAGINQSTRDSLVRAGLMTGGRGVDAARRTRAEMGPQVAQAVGNARLQRLLANAQARRQGLGARASYAGSMPAVGEDYGELLKIMAEMTNTQIGRESSMREWEAISKALQGQSSPYHSGTTYRTEDF